MFSFSTTSGSGEVPFLPNAVTRRTYSLPGKTASKSNIVGSEIFVFHGNDNPTQYDPGFAKTFSIGANSVEAVRMYRDESCRSDILAVDWSEDVQVVSSICAKRITVS